MGNTQGVWILYCALLTLKFLNTAEQMAVIGRHWNVKGTPELNQLIYFEDVLVSEWKSENVFYWGRGCAFVSTGMTSYGFFQS